MRSSAQRTTAPTSAYRTQCSRVTQRVTLSANEHIFTCCDSTPHVHPKCSKKGGAARGKGNDLALLLKLTCCWFFTSETTPFSRQSTFGGASKSAYLKLLLLPIPSPVPFNSGLQMHWIHALPQQYISSTQYWGRD